MAEDRTDWAQVRTLLAKERTFSAWLRTGLAVLVTGFALVRLVGVEEESGTLTAVGATLAGVGAVVLGLAYWSYHQSLRELEREGVRGLPSWILLAVTVALIACVLVGLVVTV